MPFAAELLLHIRTNEGPIRSVAWAPAALSDEGAALAGHSVFMTTSHDGQYTIWDARQVTFECLASYRFAVAVGSDERANTHEGHSVCLTARHDGQYTVWTPGK